MSKSKGGDDTELGHTFSNTVIYGNAHLGNTYGKHSTLLRRKSHPWDQQMPVEEAKEA